MLTYWRKKEIGEHFLSYQELSELLVTTCCCLLNKVNKCLHQFECICLHVYINYWLNSLKQKKSCINNVNPRKDLDIFEEENVRVKNMMWKNFTFFTASAFKMCQQRLGQTQRKIIQIKRTERIDTTDFLFFFLWNKPFSKEIRR